MKKFLESTGWRKAVLECKNISENCAFLIVVLQTLLMNLLDQEGILVPILDKWSFKIKKFLAKEPGGYVLKTGFMSGADDVCSNSPPLYQKYHEP